MKLPDGPALQQLLESPPARGAWIEIQGVGFGAGAGMVAPREGGVD